MDRWSIVLSILYLVMIIEIIVIIAIIVIIVIIVMSIINIIIRNSLNDAGQLGRACNMLPHLTGGQSFGSISKTLKL